MTVKNLDSWSAKVSFVVFLFCLMVVGEHTARAQEIPPALMSRYEQQIQRAQTQTQEHTPYNLSYSVDSSDPAQNAGNVIYAIQIQNTEIQDILSEVNKAGGQPFLQRGKNDFKTAVGLKVLQLGIHLDCRHCRTSEEEKQHQLAVAAMMKFYDIASAGRKGPHSTVSFSGLPFFDLITAKLQEPVFQSQVITFYKGLQETLAKLAAGEDLQTNVYQLALQATHNDVDDAIELASILLSRDSNVIKYFLYLKPMNPEFVAATSLSPLYVRLIAEVDRVQNHRVYDRFSYDGTYQEADIRNYYFWSSALVTRELSRQGFSEKEVRELNIQFPRFYKILRWWEELASHVQTSLKTLAWQPVDQEAFSRDSRTVMKISGDGSRFAIQAVKGTSAPFCAEIF